MKILLILLSSTLCVAFCPHKYQERSPETQLHGQQDDLTDRFKYKVNALMGAFDPPEDVDNERNSGHIMAAMLRFPCAYTFNAVGKTSSKEEADEFVEKIKSIVAKEASSDDIRLSVTPRGSKFTKVAIEANMDTPEAITAVYEQMQNVTNCVMQF